MLATALPHFFVGTKTHLPVEDWTLAEESGKAINQPGRTSRDQVEEGAPRLGNGISRLRGVLQF